MKQLFENVTTGSFRASPSRFLRALCAGAIIILGQAVLRGDAAESKSMGSLFEPNISGQSRTVYQYRSSGEDKDSDFYQYLFLRGRNFADRRLDFYLSGRLHRDLDDPSTSFADDMFASEEDLRRNKEDHIYQAYVDVHDRYQKVQVRAGRQYVDIAETLHMDGIQLFLLERTVLGGRVFGGRPVSYYSSVSGDWVGGLSIVGRPWQGNQTRITYARYYDDSVDESEARYALDFRESWTDELRSRVQVWMFDDSFQMAGIDMFYLPYDKDMDCVVGVRRWDEFDAETRIYSPLSSVLGGQEPYTYAYGRMTKGILPWLWVSPGVAIRVMDDSDSNVYNREYERYDLTFIVEPAKQWSASVASEYWDVNDGDRFWGVSGDVRYKYLRIWEISTGIAYQYYDYMQFSDVSYSINGGSTTLSDDGTKVEVSPDARTYFMRGKWNINKVLSLRIRGEVEDNSMEDDLSYMARVSVTARL